MTEEIILDDFEVYQIRQQKLEALRKDGFNFPNHFQRKNNAKDLLETYQNVSKEALAERHVSVDVAGRIVLRRVMGKASFFHIQDVSARIQIYLRQNELGDVYEQFKHWDLGDIVGVRGELFITQTGELTVHAKTVELLTKSLRPMPDKFHGLADVEMCYRKRYLDLMANEETRKTFIIRSRLIKACRQFMDDHQFLEVETPMMHPIPGGAVARPFITHHNTLNMDMYLRIAPELYLKRLVVGGFERVYEINRNFRNEGISTRHNPEFTMIEFYQAYATYRDLMNFTEVMLRYLADTVLGTRQIVYQGTTLDLEKPFTKLTMKDAILKHHPNINLQEIDSLEGCQAILEAHKIPFKSTDSLDKMHLLIFEETVEDKLIQPTFITAYPTEVSPLARRSEENPTITDRFEFFMMGREIANGFSELNDPVDQAERFRKQAKEKDAGDHEAMHYDSDYIEALEYGLPPTAGEGIGIDRLVMLFTNSASIRDVILFPQLR